MVNELKKVLDECFWNDYSISYQEAEKMYLSDDKSFKKLLINKIIANSVCPSSHLKALFTLEELKKLLPSNSSISYIQFRLRLIQSILFRTIEGGVRPWKK